ncbi:MAG: serine/threonine-protein kinase [Aquimonas sp.]|nr:serine/threonine-protein kinase [Aquimonas sp.]
MSTTGADPAEQAAAHPAPAGDLSALEALYHEALSVPLAARAEWVAARLGHDPAQGRLLLRMLAHAEDETTGLSKAIHSVVRETSAPRDRSGERIGRYRLIARIRHGGMAEIYRAARDDGEFDHEVALKIARSDLASPDLSTLFAAERALLARLKHPNIIEIFDGGTTPTGEAWFVMSLLDGLPLLAALGQHTLDSHQVLGHLIDLCAAVGHAHGQLIVHRDIKPENILLCRAGDGLSLRLLDFGIAAQLAGGVHVTRGSDSEKPGWHSPGYAAPETRAGRPSGAATDIYSIGRVVLDCIDQVAPRFREELRAIGEKASREDPAERYASASSLAEDLERMRRREPISLFRHRRLHVIGRALERHRWATAAGLVLVLAGGTWAVRESQLRTEALQATVRAEAERDRAAAMRDFLLNIFDSGNPALNRGEEPRVSELVVDQLDRLQGAQNLDPASHYQLLRSFASLLLQLDRRALAERAFVQAQDLAAAQFGQGSTPWIAVLARRGQLASRDARFEDAENLFQQASTALDALPLSVEAAREGSVLYSSWGAHAQRQGRLEEAERLIRMGLGYKPMLKAAGDAAGDDTSMRVTLGAILSARGDLAGALETFEAAYQDHLAAGRSQTLEHLALLGWLGISFDRSGRGAEAEPYLVEAVELAEKLFPEANSRLSGAYANLGRLYLNQGRLGEARPLLIQSLAVSEAAGDGGTPNHALRLNALGLLALEAEQFGEAVAYLEQALQLSQATLGDGHPRTQATRLALLTARVESGGRVALTREFDALLAVTADAPFRIELLLLATRVAAEAGDTERAQTLQQEAAPRLAALEADAPETPHRRWLQAQTQLALGQADTARDGFLTAAAHYQSSGRNLHPGRGRALLRAALLHPPGSAERILLGDEARALLAAQLLPPAPSLALLETL